MSFPARSEPGIGPGRPSRTSILVAAARAFGAREPDATVRNPDYLAAAFLGPEERELIAEHPLATALEGDYNEARKDMAVAGLANLMLVRTRFIDSHLTTALQNGATQLVILGAGFDTRAYRFAEQLLGKRAFEIDIASTQAFKKRRVREVLGHLPEHVTFASLDFKNQQLLDVLREAGYDEHAKTFFIWEGVSMYLNRYAVRQTLKTIAEHSAPGSSLVMDFAGLATIRFVEKNPLHPMNRFTSGWGEPWTFGIPDNQEREFFEICGLELNEIIGLQSREAQRRYLTRADGTRMAARPGRVPQAGFLARLRMLMRILPFIFMRLRHRTRFYAIAQLLVPEKARTRRLRS